MKKLLIIVLLMVFYGCDNDDCNDCGGGVLDGFLYKQITQDDLAQLEATIPNLELDTCIRFKFDLNSTDFDLETITIVDDCCCDIY